MYRIYLICKYIYIYHIHIYIYISIYVKNINLTLPTLCHSNWITSLGRSKAVTELPAAGAMDIDSWGCPARHGGTPKSSICRWVFP